MSGQIRITVEYIVEDKVQSRTIVTEKQVTKAVCISQLGFNHQEQIDILKSCQADLLQAQSPYLKEDVNTCPKCGTRLKFSGTTKSEFHSVFSDHKVPTRRQKCCNKDCVNRHANSTTHDQHNITTSNCQNTALISSTFC